SPEIDAIRFASRLNARAAVRCTVLLAAPKLPDITLRSIRKTRTSSRGASGPPSWLFSGKRPRITTFVPSCRADTECMRSGPRFSGGSGGPFFPHPGERAIPTPRMSAAMRRNRRGGLPSGILMRPGISGDEEGASGASENVPAEVLILDQLGEHATDIGR